MPDREASGEPRVICPRCSSVMKLVKTAPYRSPQRRAEVHTYRCECGYELTETIDRAPPE